MLRDTISGRGGQQKFKQDPITGVLLYYDQSRSVYLSTDRETFTFGFPHKNIKHPVWMLLTGKVNSLTNGYLVPRDGAITCLAVSSKNITTNCIFRIRSNTSGPDITTITLNGSSTTIQESLNININKGDYLRVFMDVISGKVDYPEISIEFAWR